MEGGGEGTYLLEVQGFLKRTLESRRGTAIVCSYPNFRKTREEKGFGKRSLLCTEKIGRWEEAWGRWGAINLRLPTKKQRRRRGVEWPV